MPIKMLDDPILDTKATKRFWARVMQQKNTCWGWRGTLTRGYGGFHYQGHNYKVHRIMWLLVKGNIPERLQVLHKCDNRSCVNPEHLFLGTQSDNMRDMVLKQRNKVRIKTSADLTLDQEAAIRSEYLDNDTQVMQQLAARYNVSLLQIRDVLYRVKPRIVPVNVTPQLEYQIANDYELKKGSLRDLAHKYHINASAIHAIVKKHRKD